MLATSALVIAVTSAVILAASATIARHQAQAAADLGALAGAAQAELEPTGACEAARRVVIANHATMRSCVLDRLDVIVTATVGVEGAPSGTPSAVESARAGPIQTPTADVTGPSTARTEPAARNEPAACAERAKQQPSQTDMPETTVCAPTAGAGRPGRRTDDSAFKTASSTFTASALDSGSLPLPHFGDWTHDGQPRSQPHEAMAVRVALSHSEATW
jgi:secretion/DNA translocation related TadE-like protein